MNTDSVIENINQDVQAIGELAGIQPSGVTADPANTDFFVENIDANVKAIAETLDVTPYEVEADPANTDFFVENIAKNVDLIKDNFSGGGGGGDVIEPSHIVLGGMSGDVIIKPQVTVDVSKSLTSLEQMFYQDTGITSIEFDSSIDLSKVTSINQMCHGCSNLQSVKFNSVISPITAQQTFRNCKLSESPALDLSKCTSAFSLFQATNGMKLTTTYDLSSFTTFYNFQYMFAFNPSEEDLMTTVDNVLLTLMTAINVSSGKTLRNACGSVQIIPNQAPNSQYYQDFLDAGWTIG